MIIKAEDIDSQFAIGEVMGVVMFTNIVLREGKHWSKIEYENLAIYDQILCIDHDKIKFHQSIYVGDLAESFADSCKLVLLHHIVGADKLFLLQGIELKVGIEILPGRPKYRDCKVEDKSIRSTTQTQSAFAFGWF